MNLTTLIETFRNLADDTEMPYLWTDQEIILFLNEAEAEAATRSSLLVESIDPDLCSIAVLADTEFYETNPSIIELRRVKLDSTLLVRSSFSQLDAISEAWETETGTPTKYVQTLKGIRLYPIPEVNHTLSLTVVRLPVPMTEEGPEIPTSFHAALLDWALYLAYSKRDVDVVVGADTFAKRFEQTFGPAQTANMRRQQLEQAPIEKQQIEKESASRPTWV